MIKDIILTRVRWYVAYPLSSRHVEELMEERGVSVDHTMINRWVLKYGPQAPAQPIETRPATHLAREHRETTTSTHPARIV